ncbi:unnamed protein product [Cyprideis torosa]|uniref:Uncharacterized protein n=1 Tax=Cyprideis torosa TaxID=163714 RepID=A0A7R8W657_9CRUS|nr:unnamed protein product [Cyprideis torosa]CAG0886023.1 unnamed protein product [Cyprideis torosa]
MYVFWKAFIMTAGSVMTFMKCHCHGVMLLSDVKEIDSSVIDSFLSPRNLPLPTHSTQEHVEEVTKFAEPMSPNPIALDAPHSPSAAGGSRSAGGGSSPAPPSSRPSRIPRLPSLGNLNDLDFHSGFMSIGSDEKLKIFSDRTREWQSALDLSISSSSFLMGGLSGSDRDNHNQSSSVTLRQRPSLLPHPSRGLKKCVSSRSLLRPIVEECMPPPPKRKLSLGNGPPTKERSPPPALGAKPPPPLGDLSTSVSSNASNKAVSCMTLNTLSIDDPSTIGSSNSTSGNTTNNKRGTSPETSCSLVEEAKTKEEEIRRVFTRLQDEIQSIKHRESRLKRLMQEREDSLRFEIEAQTLHLSALEDDRAVLGDARDLLVEECSTLADMNSQLMAEKQELKEQNELLEFRLLEAQSHNGQAVRQGSTCLSCSVRAGENFPVTSTEEDASDHGSVDGNPSGVSLLQELEQSAAGLDSWFRGAESVHRHLELLIGSDWEVRLENLQMLAGVMAYVICCS